MKRSVTFTAIRRYLSTDNHIRIYPFSIEINGKLTSFIHSVSLLLNIIQNFIMSYYIRNVP